MPRGLCPTHYYIYFYIYIYIYIENSFVLVLLDNISKFRRKKCIYISRRFSCNLPNSEFLIPRKNPLVPEILLWPQLPYEYSEWTNNTCTVSMARITSTDSTTRRKIIHKTLFHLTDTTWLHLTSPTHRQSPVIPRAARRGAFLCRQTDRRGRSPRGDLQLGNRYRNSTPSSDWRLRLCRYRSDGARGGLRRTPTTENSRIKPRADEK
jgi:hypothetical protein